MTSQGNLTPLAIRLKELRESHRHMNTPAKVEVYSEAICGFKISAGAVFRMESGAYTPKANVLFGLSKLYETDWLELFKLAGFVSQDARLVDNAGRGFAYISTKGGQGNNGATPEGFIKIPVIKSADVPGIVSVEDINLYGTEDVCVIEQGFINNENTTFCTSVTSEMTAGCQLCQNDSQIIVDIETPHIESLLGKVGLLCMGKHIKIKRLDDSDIALINTEAVRLIGQVLVNFQDWR